MTDLLPSLHLPKVLDHLAPRLLTLEDADALLGLRRDTLLGMPAALRAVDPVRGCAPDVERAYAQTHLGPQARTLGVFEGERLVAFACLLLADANDPTDPMHTVGVAPAEWPRCAHMAACMVAKDCWGLRLQTKLLNWRREVAVAHQRTLLLAMTACGNTYSRRNLLAGGLAIHWVGQWRPGSWWYGLYQDLAIGVCVEDHHHEWVSIDQVSRQMELIHAGGVGVAESVWHGLERRQESRLQFVRRHTTHLLNRANP